MSLLTTLTVLTISLMAHASKISFSLDSNSASQDIVHLETNGAILYMKTSSSVFEVPLLNSQEARAAYDAIKYEGLNVICVLQNEKNVCEQLIMPRPEIHSATRFRVERTKIFPAYYAAIEKECLSDKSKMMYGKAGYTQGKSIHPLMALTTGESLNYGGGFIVRIFNAQGKQLHDYPSDEREVTYLNNTNPINMPAWIKIDESREKVILLNVDTCKTSGEVSLRN